MNAAQRKVLAAIAAAVEAIDLDGIQADLEAVQGDEQDKFDNLPESFQEGTRGEAMQEAIDAIAEAIDSIAEAKDGLSAVIDAIERASA